MVGLVTRSPSPAPRRRFSAPSQKGSAYFILVPISCEIAEKAPLYTAHAWTRPSTPIFCAASGSLSAEYLSWTRLRPTCLSPPIRRRRPPTITRHTLDRRRRTNWPREIPETSNALRDFPASDTREPGRSSSNSFPAPTPTACFANRQHGGAIQAGVRLAVADVLVSLTAAAMQPPPRRGAAAGHTTGPQLSRLRIAGETPCWPAG